MGIWAVILTHLINRLILLLAILIKDMTKLLGNHFGNHLRDLRTTSGKSQAQLAEDASSGDGRKITQSILAQYESGSVAIPDVNILNQVAKALDVGCGEFIFRVAIDVLENYREAGAKLTQSEEELFATWMAVLTKKASTHADDENASSAALGSMKTFIRDFEPLDLDDLGKWQKDFRHLKVFWVITPRFVDSANSAIRDAVLCNLGRNVHYYYFIKEGDAEPGEKFYVFLDTLTFEGQFQSPTISRNQIEKLIHYVNIPRDLAGLMQTDIVIANPRLPDSQGFRSIRSKGAPVYGVRIGEEELARISANYFSYFTNKNESVFPEQRKEKNK